MRRFGLGVMGLGMTLGSGACGTAPEVSWHADIHPMMEQHCVRCHQEGGQAVGDFTDLEQVRAFSSVMLARMDAGEMPPPVADPACRDYVGSEHLSLPDEKKALFQKWIEAEMPEGKAKDAVQVEPVATELADPDLTVLMPTPYTPAFDDLANPGNEYRCFILDHGQDEDFFITSFHPVIGEPALVHHVVLFSLAGAETPQGYDPAVGLDCIDDRADAVGDLDGMIAGWAPGMSPVDLTETMPDGTVQSRGIKVRKDQKLVVQMHYYAGGDSAGLSDQSGYAFKTAPAVDTPLIMAPIGLFDFNIPAGDDSYSFSDSIDIPPGIRGRAHAVFPHMHVLGSGYRIWRERDGVTDCLVEGDYRFDNQISYVFKEPIDIEGGDKVHLECTWNNSTSNRYRIFDEPKATRYGERTDEEMCFAFTLLSVGG